MTDISVETEFPHDRPRGRHGRSVLVNRVDVESAVQEVRKVAATAAACIQHPPAAVQPTAQQLVEEVDVDGSKESLQLFGWPVSAFAAAAAQRQVPWTQPRLM